MKNKNKSYVFDKLNLRNVLLSHTIYIANRARMLLSQGVDIRDVTDENREQWAIDFIENKLDPISTSMEDLLDDADNIFKHIHGMSTLELAEKMKSNKKDIN